MSTGEDDLSSILNGRLRPRKSNPSPQTKKVLRKSDIKNVQSKPKRINALPKVSPNKTDDLDDKSDNTITPQLLCPYCDKKFISKQTASKHAHRIHLSSLKQDSNIDCLFCNHAESESNGIIRHMVDCHPNQYFACLECHTRFSSTSDLAEHKLNVCENQKLPYRSKLRQKPDGKNFFKSLSIDNKDLLENQNKEFTGEHEFNGVVISCEVKPTQAGRDEADIEDNIPKNLILPSGKGISHKAVIEKNAVIVLDDIQWNKRLPSNFTFHNTEADQILSRLGVVHKSPRSGEKKDWHNGKNNDDMPQKFEKCFDTNFYSKVASNVHENLSKYLDGSFNPNHEPDSTIRTRKSKLAINTAEGFPILLACEQYSRNSFDGYMPRAIAPKHKWKWDSPESDREIVNTDEINRDSHLDNCIITYVSNLDIWTQLSMRRKFENKCNKPVEKRAEKQNIISKELKEILESREIPITPSQGTSKLNHISSPNSGDGESFPLMLGLTPAERSRDLPPAVLSGEWVRPRCYVCCACGAQTRDPRALSSHISTQHPNASVQHYEIVGEPLLDADILKHLYVPPSQTLNRSRPLRGFRECTKCKKSITLEDLHQHMLDCAGDTPTIRRKCRYRPFGVRKRRPRLPDNRIRRKMRKDMRTGQSNGKNHLRPRPKTKSEVGDAETIRKMLADLPAKRHRVMVNPLNSFPRRKHDRKCNSLMVKKRSFNDRNYTNTNDKSSTTEGNDSLTDPNSNDCVLNNEEEEEDDDDNLPLKPKLRATSLRSTRRRESLNRNAAMNRTKRKSNKEFNLTTEGAQEVPLHCSGNNQPVQLSLNNTPERVNINEGPNNVREHSNRGGSNNRDDQQPGSSRQNGNSRDSVPPTQNVPLKHSIARLTADSETHDKSVQFHRLFLVQQECNNLDQGHVPSDRRLLFENEAVVTKLDKPPLHFNSNFDAQHQRKNKSNKPRKRLNDCIAMLKNKLTPNNEDDLPGHVSVQCGSDEPIEQEPFLMEQSLYVAQLCNDTVSNPPQQPQELPQETPVERPVIDHSNMKLDNTPMKITTEIEHSSAPQCHSNDDVESIEGNKIVSTPRSEFPKREPFQLTNAVTPEIEMSQSETLSLPRNTVIRKSPKIAVNYTKTQEELRMPHKSNTIQESEYVNNDSATKMKAVKNNGDDKLNQLTSALPEGIPETNDKRQPLTITEHYDPEADKTLKKVEIKPNNSYQINLNTQVNICENEVRLANGIEIEQNIVICPKANVELPVADFCDISCAIPPAHASTNVESIVSTPLDLSGKKRTSISSSEDTLASNYDSYETLDLSNKNVDVDQASTLASNIMDDLPSDVVVDLSIKSSQTNSANFSRKTIVDTTDGDLSYESLNDNLPTDLSVKKGTTSGDKDSQSCGKVPEFVQDLSSHNTKGNEINPERSADIDYQIKDLPTDLSSNRIDDSSLIIEILDNENDDLSTQNPTTELTKGEIAVNTCQKHAYDNSGVNLREPPINPTNDHIALNIQTENNYVLESTDIDKSVTPVLQQSILASSNIASHGAGQCQLKNSDNISNTDPVTVPQKFDMVSNKTSTNYNENTFIVLEGTVHYEKESSSLGSPTANSPLYSNNRNVTKHVPVCTFENLTTIRTSTSACVSVAKADTSSSPSLVNSLPSFLTAAMTSSGSDYSRVDNSVNANNNFIDLSSETDNSKLQGENGNKTDNYDLSKEEIIDCDVEQDNDTARKIAMLPKELVKILGTMPIDHRKQLLDVLPQYVSTAAYIESGELIVTQNSNVRSPSPVLQIEPAVRDHVEDSNKDLTHINKNASHENRIHPRPHMYPASPSSGPMISKDSIPQSVILKTPVASNDIHHSISKHSNHDYSSVITPDVNRTVSVLNCPSKLITNEKEESTIIDLTEDENIKEIHNDKQLIDNNLSAVQEISPRNQNIQSISETPSLKANSDQTASLRAVRIKAPSERIKQAASECRKEPIYVNHLVKGHDLQNIDQQRKIYTQEGAKKISNKELHVSLLTESDTSKSFDQQSNISAITLSKSSVILTPPFLEKNVSASLDESYGNHLNHDITEISAVSSQRDYGVIGVNHTIAPISAPNTDKHNIIVNLPSNELKENTAKIDEDSDDDVSLAVIVQQKQRKLAELSGDNKILTAKEDVTVRFKKRKKGKKSKKILWKTFKNDDYIMETNFNKRLREEAIDINPLASKIDKVQLITAENKRKTINPSDGVTSAEGLSWTQKIGDTILDVEKKVDDIISCTKKLKDDITPTHEKDKDPITPKTYKSNVVYTCSSLDEFRLIGERSVGKIEKTCICQQSQPIFENLSIISKEKIGFKNDKRNEEYYLKTDTIRDASQINVSPLNDSDSLIKEHCDEPKQKKQEVDQRDDPSSVNISGIDSNAKKRRGKRNKNKDFPDSYKPQSIVSFETDETSVTPLRRSRRGKSMFVDNTLVDSDVTNLNEIIIDKKAPLTKKQLIFSKLLLDEEKISKPNISAVIAKNPVVVISNVDLISHMNSGQKKIKNNTELQNSPIICSKPVKSIKRKKSPQTKRKVKKIKTLNNTTDENITKSTISNNNDEVADTSCHEQPDYNTTEQSSNNVMSLTNKGALLTTEKETVNYGSNDVQYKKISSVEGLVEQSDICDTGTKSATIEKRKKSCSLEIPDSSSTTKKTKLDNTEFEIKASEEKRRSRNRDIYTDTRNRTCYNSHVAVRRTRSKSVGVKSSTFIYDPYDIELEDMVDKDLPYGRRVKSSDISFHNLTYVERNEMKKNNKCETSIGVNTEPISSETMTEKTSSSTNSKDVIDSDDSSKSDVPLKKLVEEKEKKISELITNKNTLSADKEASTSEKKIEEVANQHSGKRQQENNRGRKSEKPNETNVIFSERKQRKSDVIAMKKNSKSFNTNDIDDAIYEAEEQPITPISLPTGPQGSPTNSLTVLTVTNTATTTCDAIITTASAANAITITSSATVASATTAADADTTAATAPTTDVTTTTAFATGEIADSASATAPSTDATTTTASKVDETVTTASTADTTTASTSDISSDATTTTEKVAKRKKTSKGAVKIAIPTLEQVLATVNKTVRDQQLSRRNLSRDEALFIDCCELLKESHKPEITATTENVTITTEVTNVPTPSQASAAEASGITANNTETDDNKNDGDVDSITAKNILESEEVRNLENDLISGLKEAAANSLAQAAGNTELKPSKETKLEKSKKDVFENPSADPQVEQHDSPKKIADEPSTTKPKKNQEPKEKMYPDVVDPIDMFEDKFDKIKRKCRSQAAAAKQVKPVVEPRLGQKERKKYEKKRGRKSTKKTPPAIPTKGALKVFDGLKVSIPTSEINMSGVTRPVEHTPKKRRRNNSKKKCSKSESETDYNFDYKVKGTQTKKVDVYEFMDNEDAELFEFRPSTLMERFKNINSRDMPGTSKYIPCNDKTDYSSESCSDGDDFVYDDYVCSDEETENSLMSCELGNGKSGNETKKCGSSLKRKDVVEKNAVMGKIFKHNAVRPEKKINKTKDCPKPKANLDQLFDSLLQDESGPSTSTYKSPKNEEFVSPRKHELPKKQESVTPKKYESLSPRKHEIITSKKHEYSTPSKRETSSPKKHGHSSSKKYETSPRGHEPEIVRKHDSAISRKHEHESYRKYYSSTTKKYECLNLEKDDHELSSKEESVTKRHESCRKHDATSKYNSGKVYPVSSAHKKDSDSPKTYDRPSKHSRFDDKPSTSNKHNSSNRDLFRSSQKSYDSMYSPSIHEPSTSKISYDGPRISKTREYKSMIDFSTMKKYSGEAVKKYGYDDSVRRYSRDKSLTADSDEDNDSMSDNEDDKRGRDAGVARQRARRKCTVGKQNVLAETWSSESDPDPGPVRAASGESGASPGARKKKGKRGRPRLAAKRPEAAAAAAVAGRRRRSRASSGAASPAPDDERERERRQQHGWIVGDSHKKLVTMLAHAKGRKRNHDDKRHNLD